jgi:transglutaminase-like putative cysteine protease
MTVTAAPPRTPGRDADRPPIRPANRISTGRILGPSVASGGAVVLASIALGPLYDSGDWFGVTLLCVAVVTAVGGVATWARLPLFLVPIVQAVALFSFLVSRFTTDAPLGFVPTPDAVSALREVMSTGMAEVGRYAPPVAVSPGVAAVTAMGVGSVALVVYVVQVSLRMPVAAGLALIAVYVVPSLVLDEGSPWWGFAAVAAGWMLLLASDERVGLVGWGRILRRSGGRVATSATSGLSSAAWRLGVVAVLTAVALPILVPSLTDAVLGRHPTGFGTGTGSGANPAQVGLSPFVSLRRDLVDQPDVVVLRYTTSAAVPTYLRTVVLEQYADEQWLPRAFDPSVSRRVTDGVALQPDIGTGVATVPETYTLASDRLATPYVPVPENATTIRGLTGQWYDDGATGTIFGVDSSTTGATWSVEALAANPTTAQFQASTPATPDLEQPRAADNLPDIVSVDAREWTAAGTTSYEKAILLQNYFLQNFRYSTAASADQSTSALESFLRDRSGYCQQFAATMALMARALGIPARVVVGYTRGTKDGDTWVVTGKDAHAWPELYFAGVGWARFEPTPRGGTDGGGVQVPVYARALPPSTPDAGPTTTPGRANGRGTLDEESAAPGVVDVPAVGSTADQWRERGLLALLVVGLLLAAVPAIWRWVRRRRRLSADASVEDAWEELRDTARDLGIEWSDARTPRQAVAGVIAGQHLTGTVAEAATRVGLVTERARYAPVPPTTAGLAEDVSAVRTALLDRVDRSTRVRATLLPASLRRSGD